MEASSAHDRIRAWARGELAPAELAELERELAGDPELAAFAAEYRELHSLLELAATLPTVAPKGRARRGWKRVAAAAAVMALALAAGFAIERALRAARLAEPVELSHIERDRPRVPEEEEPRIPAELASYHPTEDGAIQWLGSLDEARDAGRVSGRPLLLFGTLPGCPVCLRLKRTALRDGEVLSLAEEYVPVEVDLAAVDEDTRKELMSRGYPVFEVLDEDGGLIASFSGDPSVEELREHMLDALAERVDAPRALAWERVRELASLYGRAREAEREERMADARRDYERMLEDGEGRVFVTAGSLGVRRVEGAARAVLLEAMRLAGHSADDAERLLEEALVRFEGTPYAEDLAQVLERLRATGRFPTLEWAPGPVS